MGSESIRESLESKYAATLRSRKLVGRFNVVGLMLCTSIFIIFHTVWYATGGIGFVSFVTGAIAVGLSVRG